MADEAPTTPPEFDQPFGVTFHMRCMDPLVFVATTAPEAIAEGMGGLFKRYPQDTFTSDHRGLYLTVGREAVVDYRVTAGHGGRLDESAKLIPRHPADVLKSVREQACRDSVYTLTVLNPEAWFTREDVVAELLDWAKTRDERQALMVIFAGLRDTHVPEVLKPFMPRVEAGFQLDEPLPLPRDESVTLEDVSTTVRRVIMGGMGASETVAATVSEHLTGLDPLRAEMVLAHGIILAKQAKLANEQPVEVFSKDPQRFLTEALDGWGRHNAWPV